MNMRDIIDMIRMMCPEEYQEILRECGLDDDIPVHVTPRGCNEVPIHTYEVSGIHYAVYTVRSI